MNKLSIVPCFKAALKSFSKWWLVLCLVAAVPCLYYFSLIRADWQKTENELQKCWSDIKELLLETTEFNPQTDLSDLSELNITGIEVEKAEEMQYKCQQMLCILLGFVQDHIAVLAIFAIVAIVLQIILILCSKRATDKNNEEGRKKLNRGLSRSFILSFSYIVLAFVKLAPFVVLFLPALIVAIILLFVSPLLALLVLLLWFLGGLWFYARWYFTDYIITETSANPFTALGESWELTKGNQFAVWVLVLTAFILHIPAFFTLGLSTIPTRSFDFTLRATAYRQLKGEA